MYTQSVLRKATWILAGSIVVLLATLTIGSTLLVSCEPEKKEPRVALDYSDQCRIQPPIAVMTPNN